MRIAILTNDYPPVSQGGAGRIAELQAKWLYAHGHTVKVWRPGPGSGQTAGDVEVEFFPPRTSLPFAKLTSASSFSRLWFHLEDLAPNLKVIDSIKAWKPDVLLTHNLTGCGWGTPGLLHQSGLRWVHYLHDTQIFEPSGQVLALESNTGWRRAWRSFWAGRRAKALGEPDAVISPSAWLLGEHEKFGLFTHNERLVLPNPLEISLGYCEARLEDQTNILYVGRLSEDKGLPVLLEAWSLIQSGFEKLLIAGDGPLRQKVMDLHDPKIQYLGQLSHDEVMIKMYENHILAVPSLVMENQPTVILEGVAAGMKIVAADVGGVKELLGPYGQTVIPGRIEDLAQALLAAKEQTSEPALRQEILERHHVDRVMSILVAKLKA